MIDADAADADEGREPSPFPPNGTPRIALRAWEDVGNATLIFVEIPNEKGRFLRTHKCVAEVSCGACEAVPGEPCWNGKRTRYTVAAHVARIDRWNDYRKRAARGVRIDIESPAAAPAPAWKGAPAAPRPRVALPVAPPEPAPLEGGPPPAAVELPPVEGFPPAVEIPPPRITLKFFAVECACGRRIAVCGLSRCRCAAMPEEHFHGWCPKCWSMGVVAASEAGACACSTPL